MSITIGLSRGSGSPKYENYWNWIRKEEPEARIIDLYTEEDMESVLPELDALIVTGGGDIHPGEYNRPDALDLCDGIDPERDRRELRAIEYAFARKLPVICICRGLQIVNVHLGGTLIPHLPADPRIGDFHGTIDGNDNSHEVVVEPGSLLSRASGASEGIVNSSHHQGIGDLAETLTPSAYSPDGLIEAAEWLEPEQRSYLLAVQWHPERMEPGSPLGAHLLEQFLIEAHSSRIYRATTPPEPKPEPDVIEISSDDDEKKGKGGEGDSLLPIIQ